MVGDFELNVREMLTDAIPIVYSPIEIKDSLMREVKNKYAEELADQKQIDKEKEEFFISKLLAPLIEAR